MTSTLWRHQGLNFEAPFAMGTELAAGAAADVLVRVSDPKPVGTDTPGPVLAEMRTPEQCFYTMYRPSGSYLVRFHGSCEFWVSDDASEVVCVPGPGCDEGILPVLMVGTVTALLLTLRGYAVLHGSAVRWQDQTVLFAGRSGKGKTTLAALCCAAGAELVSDDVVPLLNRDGRVVCFGLGQELRLREAAKEIADLFPPPGPLRRCTADGRLAIKPAMAADETNAVSAVLLPEPTRGALVVTSRSIASSAAVGRLLANARVPAMVPLSLQQPYFSTVLDLVASVPVIEVSVPWGPPFSTDFVPQLFGEVLGREAPTGAQL